MDMIFDFGMFDGSDAEYYLETGYKVIAVDAYPPHCAMAAKRLAKYVESGQLVIENMAISNTHGTVDLHICGQDLGSNSIVAERLTDRFSLGKYTVPTTTYDGLVAKYGLPMLLKIDIEGADRECVLGLTSKTAPMYLSFEAHTDLPEMIDHARSCGYQEFKIIQQTSFRSLQNQDAFMDRVRMKMVRLAGYDKPLTRKIDGRLHLLGHSAGPAPWHSDGRWYSKKEILRDWEKLAHRGWYDVHAAMPDRKVVPRASAARAGLWWWAGTD